CGYYFCCPPARPSAPASADPRRGLRWLAVVASAAAPAPPCWASPFSAAVASHPFAAAHALRWLAVAASAAARGPEPLAAADRSGPAFPAAVVDPVAVFDPVVADAVAADCRLLVLDRSSVHVRPDARRAAGSLQGDPAHRRQA